MNQAHLVELLFPFGDPALWQCPLQQGVPVLLIWAGGLILWAAAAAFIFGIIYTALSYLTAYGSDERIKEAKKTLKWIFIGAAVILLSEVVIHTTAVLIAGVGQVQQPPRGTQLQQLFQTLTPQQATLIFREGTCGNAASRTRSDNRPARNIAEPDEASDININPGLTGPDSLNIFPEP